MMIRNFTLDILFVDLKISLLSLNYCDWLSKTNIDIELSVQFLIKDDPFGVACLKWLVLSHGEHL